MIKLLVSGNISNFNYETLRTIFSNYNCICYLVAIHMYTRVHSSNSDIEWLSEVTAEA